MANFVIQPAKGLLRTVGIRKPSISVPDRIQTKSGKKGTLLDNIVRLSLFHDELTSGGSLTGASPTASTPPPVPTPSSVSLDRPSTSSTGAAPSAPSASSAPSAQPYFAPSPAQHITVNAPIAPTPPVQLPQIQASSPSIAGQRSKVGSSAGVHTSSQGVAPAPVSALSGIGSSIVSNQNRRKKII